MNRPGERKGGSQSKGPYKELRGNISAEMHADSFELAQIRGLSHAELFRQAIAIEVQASEQEIADGRSRPETWPAERTGPTQPRGAASKDLRGRIPTDLFESSQDLSKMRGLTHSELIRQAIAKELAASQEEILLARQLAEIRAIAAERGVRAKAS